MIREFAIFYGIIDTSNGDKRVTKSTYGHWHELEMISTGVSNAKIAIRKMFVALEH